MLRWALLVTALGCASSFAPDDAEDADAGFEMGAADRGADGRFVDASDRGLMEQPQVRRLSALEAELRGIFCRCAADEGLFESEATCLADTPLTLDSEREITCVEGAFQSEADVPIFNCRVQSFADYVGCLSGCSVTNPAGDAFRRCSEAQQASNARCGGISEATNDARSVCVDQ